MDPMVVWLGWLALFLVYELYAAISKPKGDTLSEGIWRWFGVKAGRAARRFSPLRRVVLAAFMLALTAHFVFGLSVVPVIVTGALVFAVIVYSTFFERVPLVVLALLALPLLGAKACGPSCADLTKALEVAKASGDTGAIAAAGWALAEAGCPIVVEPPPATCADGLPPVEGKCPTVCADLACAYGCDQTPSGAVCKPKPEEPQACPDAPQGALVCDGEGQCGCWGCSGRTGYVWTEMPACPPPCPAAPSCPAGEHAEVQSPGNPCTVYTGRCVADAPPPPAGCSIDGEPGAKLPDHRPALGGEVNAAMTALSGCEPGSRCVLQEGRQAWQARVVAELRRRGVCAGQHSPETDEIAAATSVTSPREGWHVYAGPDGGPGTVVWSPGASRPAYAAPPPPVDPPPAQGACPPAMVAAIEDQAARQMVAKPAACKRCFDSTPRVCDHPDAAILAERPGQRCVPLGPDGSGMRASCEALFLAGPTPEWRAGPGVSLEPDPPLAWQVKAFGSGRLRACDRRGVTCSTWLDVQ